MDFQLSSNCSTLVLSLFLILLLVFLTKTRRRKSNSYPPGPWKLPIIGSIHHLIGALPHRAFRDLSNKFGPVMHLKIGEVDHIIISSREAAEEVMKTNDINFASRPDIPPMTIVAYGATDIAFSPYGPYWRQLRKICMLELFSAKRVKSFASVREEEMSKLISDISSCSPPVNLSKTIRKFTNTVVTRASYGRECRQQERFISTLEEISKLASGFSIAELFPSIKFLDIITRVKFRAERIHRHIDDIFEEIIREHQSTKDDQECLLDVLLRIKEEGDVEFPLTMDSIKAVILIDIFAAGTETSATIVEWTMAELMRKPEVMEKIQREVREILRGKEEKMDLQGELKYLKLVIKETVRLHPPLPFLFPRICAESCDVAGYTIRAGSKVIINAWALGRDPRYWEDAESFKPERFEDIEFDFKGNRFEYLPFGSGRRICPGMSFGMATVEIALARLLFHFDWQLPEGVQLQDLDFSETFGLSIGMRSDLLLRATLHNA